MKNDLKKWLTLVEKGALQADEAYERVKGYEEISDFAKVDIQRAKRKGFPEVIYGEGKTVAQIKTIFSRLKAHHETVLATRIAPEQATHLVRELEHVRYDDISRTLLYDT